MKRLYNKTHVTLLLNTLSLHFPEIKFICKITCRKLDRHILQLISLKNTSIPGRRMITIARLKKHWWWIQAEQTPSNWRNSHPNSPFHILGKFCTWNKETIRTGIVAKETYKLNGILFVEFYQSTNLISCLHLLVTRENGNVCDYLYY